MFLECHRENEKIIEIACHEVIYVIMKDVVNVVLENTRGIAETKRHDYVFIEAIVSMENCFPFFTRDHT